MRSRASATNCSAARRATARPLVVPSIINAGQHASAALYSTPADIYEAQYAATIVDLVPGTLGGGDLVSQGKLPATAPVRGRLDAADGRLYPVLRRRQPGPHRLPQRLPGRPGGPSLRARTPAAPLACAPAQALRKWLVRNDLRSYTPIAPTLLCGGHADPTVPFFNTTAAAAYFRARGATMTQLDIDDMPSLNDPFRSAKAGFVAAKDHPARGRTATAPSRRATTPAWWRRSAWRPRAIISSRCCPVEQGVSSRFA